MAVAVLPPLVQRRSPNFSTRRGAEVRLLVWHESAGVYRGDIAWLCNPVADASAHLVLREDGGECTQLVPLGEKAWHAFPHYNPVSVDIEHSNLTGKGYATEDQLQVSARVFGWLCLHLDIPPRFARGGVGRGVCRHSDLGALGGGHTQCGPGDAAWGRFLVMLHDEIERGGYRKVWAKD